MRTPPPVADESRRLAALEQSGLLFSPAEERFDRITRLASHVLGAPISLMSLIGDTSQWVKSTHGSAADESPRELTFCAHAIAAGDGLVVEDAAADERFADNPFVTGEPHVAAYAGRVIHARTGEPLGTLCVIDRKARRFSHEELARLADLAAIAEEEIARTAPGLPVEYLRALDAPARKQRIDRESHLLNHDAMLELLLAQADRGTQAGTGFCLVLVRIPQLPGVRQRLGDKRAAAVTREAASTLLRAVGAGDALGRFDEDTFLVVTADDLEGARRLAGHLAGVIGGKPIDVDGLSIPFTAQVAADTWSPGTSLAALVEGTVATLGSKKRK